MKIANLVAMVLIFFLVLTLLGLWINNATDIRKILDTNFITTLCSTAIGSALAAFAGAYVAQKIVDSSKNNDRILEEIRNTNAARVVAGTILNELISVKAFFEPWFNQYIAGRNAVQSFRAENPQTPTPGVRIVHTSMEILNMPIDVLAQKTYEKIYPSTKTTAFVSKLHIVLEALNASIVTKNRLTEEAGSLGEADRIVRENFYFGVGPTNGQGRIGQPPFWSPGVECSFCG